MAVEVAEPNLDLEDGEIDPLEGLFMVDLTPAVIPQEIAFADEQPVVESIRDDQADEEERKRTEEQEEEDMLIFKNEVAMDSEGESEEEDSNDDSEEDDEDAEAATSGEQVIYDDPDALSAAIRGKITDDSAAKVRFLGTSLFFELGGEDHFTQGELFLFRLQVTGRYYKEDDLTRSCGLCGGKACDFLRRLDPALNLIQFCRTRAQFKRLYPCPVRPRFTLLSWSCY